MPEQCYIINPNDCGPWVASAQEVLDYVITRTAELDELGAVGITLYEYDDNSDTWGQG